MLLNSLTGEIAHLNSLSNDFFTGYKIETTLVNGFHFPLYFEFTELELSEVWLHPLKVNKGKSRFNETFEPVKQLKLIAGIQGSLF